jgi:hypothetical protein
MRTVAAAAEPESAGTDAASTVKRVFISAFRIRPRAGEANTIAGQDAARCAA